MTIYCGRTKSFLQEKLYENHSPSYYEQTVAIPFCERGKVCNSCYEILYTVPFTNGASSTIRLLHAYVTTGCFIVRLVEMGPSRIFLQGRTLSLLLLSLFSLTNMQPCLWAGLQNGNREALRYGTKLCFQILYIDQYYK